MAGQFGGNVGSEVDVYTQNMQGGSNFGFAVQQIRQHDVVMLQESGNPWYVNEGDVGPNGLVTGQVNFGSSSRRCDRNFIHYPNGRCSLTIFTDTEMGDPEPFLVPAPSPTLRPMVGASVGDVDYINFHAPSGNHNAARGVLNSQFNALENVSNSFIAGGDGNSDLTQQNTDTRNAFVTGEATQQSGGHLDGFVATGNFGGSASDVGMRGGDHVGVSGRFH